MMDEYAEAQTKPDKSNIITKVVTAVRKEGSFVKKHMASGKWVYAEDLLCREKVSQTFRDSLHQTHKSSDVTSQQGERKREFEQFATVSDEEESFLYAKRMRRTAAPSAPNHLFDWSEMPPLGGQQQQVNPMHFPLLQQQRPEESMMSVFVDTFGAARMANEMENPFEPTPIIQQQSTRTSAAFQFPQQEQRKPSMNLSALDFVKQEEQQSWKVDRSQQQFRRNSIYFDDDISVITSVEDDFLAQDEEFLFNMCGVKNISTAYAA